MSTEIKKQAAPADGVRLSRAEYIGYLANKSDLISMHNNNKKTGPACLTLSFPLCACRPDAPCKKLCYAAKGTQQFSNVQGAYYRNWRLYFDDKALFFEQVRAKIKFSGLPLVRLFDSGDFPDAEFLPLLVRLCIDLPGVKFAAITKKYELVNDFISAGGVIPDNLKIGFSAWGRGWSVPNPYNLPVYYVNFKNAEDRPAIPAGAFHCPGAAVSCSACRACFIKDISSIYFDEH